MGQRSRSRIVPAPLVVRLSNGGILFQVLIEPGNRLAPSVLRRLLAVAAPGFAVEAMARPRVLVEFVRLATLCQLGIYFVDKVRSGICVFFAKKTQDRAIDVGCLLKGRRAVAQGDSDVAAIEDHGSREVRDVAGGQVGHASAKAEPYDPRSSR